MGFDYIIQMDCDFSHDPKEVKNLLSECQSKDLVIGSRYVGGIRIINCLLTGCFFLTSLGYILESLRLLMSWMLPAVLNV